MRVLTLQPRQPLIPQPVLWQHPPNSPSQDLTSTPFFKHHVHRHAAQATGASVVRVVLLLETLLAGRAEVVAADGDNVVAAVRGRVVDRLVFAHEGERDRGGKAAETAAVCADVNVVPCSRVGETGLYRVTWW